MASFGRSSREWLAAACIVRERVQTKVEVQRRAAADVAKVNRRKLSVLRPARSELVRTRQSGGRFLHPVCATTLPVRGTCAGPLISTVPRSFSYRRLMPFLQRSAKLVLQDASGRNIEAKAAEATRSVRRHTERLLPRNYGVRLIAQRLYGARQVDR